MAQLTITTGSVVQHGMTRKGHGGPVVQYFQASTCASTLVIQYGDIVSQDTSVSTGGFRVRQAYRAGGNGANLLAVGQHIVGVAFESDASDGSATGLSSGGAGAPLTRQIGVIAAEPDTEYVAFLGGDTAVAVSRSSLVGQDKAVRYDSTNRVFLIDSTNSTAALVTARITGIPDGSEGDVNGRVYFKFLSSNVSEAVA